MIRALLLVAAGAVHADLVADEFVKYTGYNGVLNSVSGVVGPVKTTTHSTGTAQQYSYNLAGVDPLCVSGKGTAADSCLIAFYTGRSCTADAGSKYYVTATDPWALPNSVHYTSSAGGVASAVSVTAPTGIVESELHGKTVIVHAFDGTKIACARLWDETFIQKLAAVPRVSKDNCKNLMAIISGAAKAVPVYDFNNKGASDHVKAGVIRSFPILSKEACAKTFPDITTSYFHQPGAPVVESVPSNWIHQSGHTHG